MGELRKDPTRGRWVLVRPAGPERTPGAECPFCPGNEALTPPEITAYRKEGSSPDGPGWFIRVIPEADPYFRIERDLVREGVGLYDKVSPRGATELIIESPSHDHTPATMGEGQWEQVLWMYRSRLLDLKRDPAIRDILITRRHRKPGARITHPYSRVTAIPIIFDDVRRKLDACRDYHRYKRRCLYCDIIRQELQAGERVIRSTERFVVLVPYAARSPFEVWLLPRQHACAYEEAANPEVVGGLAELLAGYFRVLEEGFGDPTFEMTFYSSPNRNSKILPGEWATLAEDYHWHLEIVLSPERLASVGGICVNEVPAEAVAERLRQAWP